MKKANIFQTELGYIRNEKYRQDAEFLIEKLPDYFFEIPASSTGKYHPSFASTKGGLVKHTKVAVRIAHELLENDTVGAKFTLREKDLIIVALLLHDGLKSGLEKSKYTLFEHPLLVSKYIMEQKECLQMEIDDIRFVCTLIESHMGQWTYDSYHQKEVLPKPTSAAGRFVHMCDFLSSKKFLDVKFNDLEIDG